MDRWFTLPQAAARVSRQSGHEISVDDIIDLAMQGHVRLGVGIPGWLTIGVGELDLHNVDGTHKRLNMNGFVLLDRNKLGALTLHGRVELGGLRWGNDGDDPNDVDNILIVAPGAPSIEYDDLRILEGELPRIVAIVLDHSIDSLPPRRMVDLGGAARAEHPPLPPDPGAHWMQRWQDVAKKLVELRSSMANLLPSELAIAIQQEEEYKKQQQALEAEPGAAAAIAGYIAYHQALLADVTSAIERAHLLGMIRSWRAHLERITAGRSSSIPLEQQIGEGEPVLMAGRNPRPLVFDWIAWAAKRFVTDGDTRRTLATKIVELAARRQIESELGPLDVNTIDRHLPAGITGGRRGPKPGSKSRK